MSSLFSPNWYRVSALRPRLRTQARVSRHIYRGERWYILQDLGSGRHLRLSPTAYHVVALMDGLRTVDEIWRHICMTQGDEASSQEEIVQLLSQLHASNVLISDKRPDTKELRERGVRTRRMKLKQYLANPLSLKIPLLDPDRLLTALVSSVSPNAWRWIMALWGLLVGSALFGAVYYWQPLTEDLAARSFTPENVLLMGLIFPILKVIHEFGHGIAIKAFGGACREMGVMLLVFLPIPYVDASQSTGFPDKRRRMIVGAAGMMIELAVAACAFWLWTGSEPGLFKSVLHQAIILSGVTTLMFNANPLLRFDGYYIAADWLEIPNFGNKANRYIGYLITHHIFRSEVSEPLHLTPREGYWLVSYAVASFFYRIAVALAIIFFVANAFFFVGVLLALWAAWTMLLLPLFRQLQSLVQHQSLEGVRGRAWLMTGSFVVLIGLIVFVWPAPSWTSAEGVIWMTDDARVRSAYPCFGKSVLVSPGTTVKAGQALIDCGEPQLDAQLRESEAKLDELNARFSSVSQDRVQMQIVRAEIEHAQMAYEDLQARRSTMVMSSDHDGIFYMEAPNDFPGRFVERGEAVAYVLDPKKIALFTVVPQGEVDLVRQKTRHVELRVAGNVWQLVTAKVRREVPGATRELPSLALSLAGGGQIGLDPEALAAGEPAALTSLFQFELALPENYPVSAIGSRVHVRFVHTSEPLGIQWYRTIRQTFLKRFSV